MARHTMARYRTHPVVLKLALRILKDLREREREWTETRDREQRKGWSMSYCVHGEYTGDPRYGWGGFKKCTMCELGVTIHEEALGAARRLIYANRDEMASVLGSLFFGNQALLTREERETLVDLIERLAYAHVPF
jgi:hypothetical protein